MPYDDIIEKHANRVGVDPSWMKKIMRIESGGDAGNVTGSYKGLFQLSKQEFNKHGGTGNILDPEQNTMAAANKLAQDKLTFKQKYGKDPTLADVYMVHQQGEAGYGAHMANPDGTAWQNIRKYYSSDSMAKKAIWGNIPDSQKAQFGSVDNVTSKDFTTMWGNKVEGHGYEKVGPFMASKKTPDSEAESEGTMGTRRGSFLGEDKPQGSIGDFPQQQIPDLPNMSIPTVGSSKPAPSRRAPQVAGATRWEV